MTSNHILSIRRQNPAELDTLNCFVLFLTPLTFSYLSLSYPPYPYLLAPIGDVLLCCETYAGVFAVLPVTGTKKRARPVERALHNPTIGVVGYPPKSASPRDGGRQNSLSRQYRMFYLGSKSVLTKVLIDMTHWAKGKHTRTLKTAF